MKTVLVEGAGATVTLEVEGTDTVQWVRQRVSESTGIPQQLLALSHCSKPLHDHQTLSELPISSAPILRASLRLLGGVIEPERYKLALSTVVAQICRKCYCRNGMDRTTCHKCGWPDLRLKKRNASALKKLYSSLSRK